MTKKELAAKVKTDLDRDGIHNGLTAQQIEAVINSTLDMLRIATLNREPVYLRKFGTFSAKWRAPKKARNIRAGTSIDMEGFYRPFFKPSKEFMSLLKKAKDKHPE